MLKVVCLLLSLLASAPAFAADWKLVWSDEFDGKRHALPDPAKWTYDLGASGWGNHELEAYTNRPENVSMDGKGHLVITARRNGKQNYTSARLKTKGKYDFAFGRAAVRMKIPRGHGLWPAFWMLGANIDRVNWPACGEIDVMENIGREPATVHGTIHGPGYSGSKGIGHPFTTLDGTPLSADFHVYAVEWSPESITFSLDEHPYFTVTPASLPPGTRWVYDHPFFLLLNLAVGGGWPGNPDRTTHFPAKLVVDWVRVWQRPGQ